MAIGDRIRIISEEEYRIMSPPRRPRGEKPATTIRILQRQLVTSQQLINALRVACADKEKVIAGYDVQLSEADDKAQRLQSRNVDQAIWLGEANEKLRQKSERLAFLEGYYARTQELLPHDPAKTHRGPSSGDPQNIQDGRQGSEVARQETGPGGTGGGTRFSVRSHSPYDTARPDWRPLEEPAVMEAARDATQSELARYRR